MNSRRVSSSEGEREYITEIGGGEVPSSRVILRSYGRCFTENIGVVMVLFRIFERSGASSEIEVDFAEREGLDRQMLKHCVPGRLLARKNAAAPIMETWGNRVGWIRGFCGNRRFLRRELGCPCRRRRDRNRQVK